LVTERIGEILAARGVVTPAQVATALDAQLFNGGRLGTNLVDQCEIDLDVITDALAAQKQMTPALQIYFDQLNMEVASVLSAAEAARFRMIPLCVGGQPQSLAVASMDPLGPEALALLDRTYGMPIRQGVAPELRILYYLERVYGVERSNRYRRPRPRRKSGPPDGTYERRSYAYEIHELPEPGSSAVGKIPIKKMAFKIVGEVDPNLEVDTPEKAVRAMRRVNDREKIGQLIVSCLCQAFDGELSAGLVFIMRERLAICWQGFARHPDVNLDGLGVPVDEPGILQVSLGKHEPFFGQPPGGGTELDRLLFEHLRCGEPAEIATVAIELHDRVGCLIYAQSRNPLSDKVRQGISELASGVNAAFRRLVRAAER
jgi:hypothetical protein